MNLRSRANLARFAPAMPVFLAMLALAACRPAAGPEPRTGDAAAADVTEYAIPYPDPAAAAALAGAGSHGGMDHAGSTHEIVYDERRRTLWVTGQIHDALVRIRFGAAGAPAMAIEPMPPGSGPHGIAFDAAGNRWVTLEFQGRVVATDGSGARIADHERQPRLPDLP